MSARVRRVVFAGLIGALVYVAMHALFDWSKLLHESRHERLVDLGWMLFQAGVFSVIYWSVQRFIFGRYAYQANSSKSER